MKNQAFTLIEILVVVLIIGILSAIAVPQYQKSVWKARSRQMLLHIKALFEDQENYYLGTGTYASNFSDLDISFTGYNKTCRSDAFPKTDCMANDYSNLFINRFHEDITLFMSGPYKYSGFLVRHEKIDDSGVPLKEILCYHFIHGGGKNMCAEFFDCTLAYSDGSNTYSSCKYL